MQDAVILLQNLQLQDVFNIVLLQYTPADVQNPTNNIANQNAQLYRSVSTKLKTIKTIVYTNFTYNNTDLKKSFYKLNLI